MLIFVYLLLFYGSSDAQVLSTWTNWSRWSECQGGRSMRTRGCYTVVGARCFGPNIDFRSCATSESPAFGKPGLPGHLRDVLLPDRALDRNELNIIPSMASNLGDKIIRRLPVDSAPGIVPVAPVIALLTTTPPAPTVAPLVLGTTPTILTANQFTFGPGAPGITPPKPTLPTGQTPDVTSGTLPPAVTPLSPAPLLPLPPSPGVIPGIISPPAFTPIPGPPIPSAYIYPNGQTPQPAAKPAIYGGILPPSPVIPGYPAPQVNPYQPSMHNHYHPTSAPSYHTQPKYGVVPHQPMPYRPDPLPNLPPYLAIQPAHIPTPMPAMTPYPAPQVIPLGPPGVAIGSLERLGIYVPGRQSQTPLGTQLLVDNVPIPAINLGPQTGLKILNQNFGPPGAPNNLPVRRGVQTVNQYNEAVLKELGVSRKSEPKPVQKKTSLEEELISLNRRIDILLDKTSDTQNPVRSFNSLEDLNQFSDGLERQMNSGAGLHKLKPTGIVQINPADPSNILKIPPQLKPQLHVAPVSEPEFEFDNLRMSPDKTDRRSLKTSSGEPSPWSVWSLWSACNCGWRTRTRTCNYDHHSQAFGPCNSEPSYQQQECQGGFCSFFPSNSDQARSQFDQLKRDDPIDRPVRAFRFRPENVFGPNAAVLDNPGRIIFKDGEDVTLFPPISAQQSVTTTKPLQTTQLVTRPSISVQVIYPGPDGRPLFFGSTTTTRVTRTPLVWRNRQVPVIYPQLETPPPRSSIYDFLLAHGLLLNTSTSTESVDAEKKVTSIEVTSTDSIAILNSSLTSTSASQTTVQPSATHQATTTEGRISLTGGRTTSLIVKTISMTIGTTSPTAGPTSPTIGTTSPTTGTTNATLESGPLLIPNISHARQPSPPRFRPIAKPIPSPSTVKQTTQSSTVSTFSTTTFSTVKPTTASKWKLVDPPILPPWPHNSWTLNSFPAQPSENLPPQRWRQPSTQQWQNVPTQRWAQVPTKPRETAPDMQRESGADQQWGQLPTQQRARGPTQQWGQVLPQPRENAATQRKGQVPNHPGVNAPGQSWRQLPTQQKANVPAQQWGQVPIQQRESQPAQQWGPVPTEPRQLPTQQNANVPVQQWGQVPTQQRENAPTQLQGQLSTQQWENFPGQQWGQAPTQQKENAPVKLRAQVSTQPWGNLPAQGWANVPAQQRVNVAFNPTTTSTVEPVTISKWKLVDPLILPPWPRSSWELNSFPVHQRENVPSQQWGHIPDPPAFITAPRHPPATQSPQRLTAIRDPPAWASRPIATVSTQRNWIAIPAPIFPQAPPGHFSNLFRDSVHVTDARNTEPMSSPVFDQFRSQNSEHNGWYDFAPDRYAGPIPWDKYDDRSSKRIFSNFRA